MEHHEEARGKAHAHVHDTAHECDPELSDPAEIALDRIGTGRQHVHGGDEPEINFAFTNHFRICGKQSHEKICEKKTDRNQFI